MTILDRLRDARDNSRAHREVLRYGERVVAVLPGQAEEANDVACRDEEHDDCSDQACHDGDKRQKTAVP
jgi:hypothetical protein